MGDGKGQHVDNCRGIEKGTRSRYYGRGHKADMGWEPLFLALSLPFCLVWLESSHFFCPLLAAPGCLAGGTIRKRTLSFLQVHVLSRIYLCSLIQCMDWWTLFSFFYFFFFQYPIHFLRTSISSSFPLLSSPSFSFTLSRLTLRPRPPPFPSCSL